MNLTEAVAEIRTFWPHPTFAFAGGGQSRLAALELEFERTFPPELREYIAHVIPSDSCSFEGIGNPFDVYGHRSLSRRLLGYNYNPVTNEPIPGWEDSWFLVGDEGSDPIIVDLNANQTSSPVLQAMHGAGEWEFDVIASSIGQFLLLASAMHHAMLMLPRDELIIDDEGQFHLACPVAEWLFPRVKAWAPEYYGTWVGAFGNA